MVAAALNSEIISSPQTTESRFGEMQYDLLHPSGGKAILHIDRIHSRSTEYARLEVMSPASIGYVPRDDSLGVLLRPAVNSGLGPFRPSREKLLGIATTTHETPFWSTELPGTEIHCLTVRRSLLAKHAFDIVDTDILQNTELLTLDADRAKLVLNKINDIVASTKTTQALDIRLTHLLLSICEIEINPPSTSKKQEAQYQIWKHLTLEDPPGLNAETLLERTGLTEHQLNHIFRRQTGLSARQFISSFKLNKIRQELQNKGRRYSDCVTDYGYQSPDQLYKAYLKLFAEEPPLNIH